eukprot:6204160-Pleurochrysis_carterae.AAC.1
MINCFTLPQHFINCTQRRIVSAGTSTDLKPNANGAHGSSTPNTIPKQQCGRGWKPVYQQLFAMKSYQYVIRMFAHIANELAATHGLSMTVCGASTSLFILRGAPMEQTAATSPRVLGKFDPHFASPRLEAVEGVVLRQLQLLVLSRQRPQPIAREVGTKHASVPTHIGHVVRSPQCVCAISGETACTAAGSAQQFHLTHI